MQKNNLDTNYKYDFDAMNLNPNSRDYKKILIRLAKQGDFDTHTTKFNTSNQKNINGEYVFVPKNLVYRVTRTLVKAIVNLFGPIVTKVAFNLKVVGRENLKGVKSAITVSNHVHYLDVLMNMLALGGKKFYIVGAPHNMKRGIAGYLLKAGGMLPLSTSLSASKNLKATITNILNKGGFVHMYAESALWFRYEKSRPLKIGAFKMACENNVPVVPIVILFRNKNKLEFFRKKKTITLKICKPIYPDENLPLRERATKMMNDCQETYNNTICDFYGYDRSTYSIFPTPEELNYYDLNIDTDEKNEI